MFHLNFFSHYCEEILSSIIISMTEFLTFAVYLTWQNFLGALDKLFLGLEMLKGKSNQLSSLWFVQNSKQKVI